MTAAGPRLQDVSLRTWMLAVLAAGLGLGVVLDLVLGVRLAPLIAWIVTAFVFELGVWLVVFRMDATETASRAAAEDPTTTVVDVLLLGVNLLSLFMIVYVVVRAGDTGPGGAMTAALLSLASAAVSWLLVQTLFTLRYAALYYDEPRGGVDFNGPDLPRYVDFAYLAFTMGMTYQVSDTNLQTTQFRALVLRHGLTSYLFGTVIIAATINLVLSLPG